MSHPVYTLLAAAIVSAAMHRKLRPAVRMFVTCIAGVVIVSWLMHWIK